MDPLTLISKVIEATGRVGAAFALAAGVVYVGRRSGVEFFTGLDSTVYQTVVLAGLDGAGTVAVELAIALWVRLRAKAARSYTAFSQTRTRKRTAIKNMNALIPEYAEVLRFLKSNNAKRFPANADSQLLHLMQDACLLEIDDPNWSLYSVTTYYLVPDYVWNEIDARLKSYPVPQSAPWIRTDWP